MSGLLVVIPVLSLDIAEPCIDSILADDNAAEFTPDELLLIDNTRGGIGDTGLTVHRDSDGHNLGVARSWGIGVHEVLERDLDYLVILSESIRFGPILHTTWRRQLERFWGENVIEAEGLSWKAIAIHRRVFERVGTFDGCLWPGYWEAQDFAFRMRLVGMEGGWTRIWFNAMAAHVAAHSHLVKAAPLLAYMEAKWGGPKHHETFTLPFGDKPLGWFEDVPIPELAARYGYGPRFTDWW